MRNWPRVDLSISPSSSNVINNKARPIFTFIQFGREDAVHWTWAVFVVVGGWQGVGGKEIVLWHPVSPPLFNITSKLNGYG